MSETAVIDYYFDMVLTITLGIDYSWLHIPASPISAPPKLLGRGTRCRFTKVPCLMPEFSILGSWVLRLLGFPRLGGQGLCFPLSPGITNAKGNSGTGALLTHTSLFMLNVPMASYGHLEDTRNVQEGGWGPWAGAQGFRNPSFPNAASTKTHQLNEAKTRTPSSCHLPWLWTLLITGMEDPTMNGKRN